MAAGIIQFDRGSDAMRMKVRALQMIREGFELLRNQRLIDIQFRDGDGSQAAHYDLLAAAGDFAAGDYADANAAAKASFDELDSLYSKLATDASVTAVNAAIYQACAKHGV
jgi:hypothetical protein